MINYPRFISLLLGLFLTWTPFIASSALLTDGFESGDMSTSNTEGFSWGSNNSTSIVSADKVVWNNGPKDVAKPSGRDWTPKDGLYSLRFHYPAGTDQMAEQRFSIGNDHSEIWVQFWLRVPPNYKSVVNSRSGNSKLLALWMDGYEGAGQGATCVWEFWRDGSGGASVALRTRNEMNKYNSGHNLYKPFITYPTDQGRWMQLTFRVKAETSQSANDGIMQMWRRWEGEAKPTQIHNWTGLDIPIPSTASGFRSGYLLGWSNPGYLETTEFQIDGVIISDTSLMIRPKAPIPNPVR